MKEEQVMGLLYKIYQSVQIDREPDEDDLAGRTETFAPDELPVSLLQLLANPVGGAAGRKD